jgi:glucans biosynthesis protein
MVTGTDAVGRGCERHLRMAAAVFALMPAMTLAEPFSRALVIDAASALAARPYTPPPTSPASLLDLDYDTYRQIRYDKSEAIWGQSRTRFAVELFAPGFLFRDLIDIAVVENGEVRAIVIDEQSFDTDDPLITAALVEAGKFAGFRLHYPLNRADYRDEFLVFQGASYFRGVSSGQTYGLSARGLAIDVAEPTGEEFPVFRAFWIERPAADANAIVVHATLDSPRVAGAFSFRVYPGAILTIDVTATLFPREPLDHVGIAPLTSMYLHGPADPSRRPDYRPAVHDSEGLAIVTGRGEYLWRPLTNPQSLQTSAFVDDSPAGFGLLQRSREFASYQDLEARYHRRPSAWVTPRGDWGTGDVHLVEIPTPEEVNDNIVAYWRPRQPLMPGEHHEFTYRLTWPGSGHKLLPRPLARVVRTARGLKLGDRRGEIVIDYATPAGASPTELVEELTLDIAAPVRLELKHRVQTLEDPPGYRVFLDYRMPIRETTELRVQPMHNGAPAGETWLFRLTP